MKIGFIQLGRIGDMVLYTPAFSAIKTKYPDAEIYVVSGRGNAIVLRNNPHIHRVIRFNKTPFELLKFILKLKSIKLDYWIDPKDHFSTESKWIAKIAKAKHKVVYNEKLGKVNPPKFFTDMVFDSLETLGISKPASTPKPELYLKQADRDFAKSLLLDNTKKNILINISATADCRIYSAENWEKVLSEVDLSQVNVYISAMPSEKEIATYLYHKFVDLQILPQLQLFEIAALIEQSDMVITPDTSIVHIAAAFEKNVIALHNDDGNNFIKFSTKNPKAEILKIKGGREINQIPPEMISNLINSKV